MTQANRIRHVNRIQCWVDKDISPPLSDRVYNPIAARLGNQVDNDVYYRVGRHIPQAGLRRPVWWLIDFQAREDCGNDPS